MLCLYKQTFSEDAHTHTFNKREKSLTPWGVCSGTEGKGAAGLGEGGDWTFHHRQNVNFEFYTV